MSGELITGYLFLVLGGFSAIRPDLFLKFRVWMAKKVYGAQFHPSEKTHSVQRIIGVIFVIIALIIINESL